MQLSLTDRQADVLRTLLESAISDLSPEISNTDNAQYRGVLREQREVLKSVLDALG